MKLSVITINYNNASGLEKTIKSIVSQSFADFEYIVVDGASTDSSVDIIKQYADKINYWVSEPDKGIYNAMNKGIKQAKGEYLIFINSGDILYRNTILEEVFSKPTHADWIYGDLELVYPNGDKVIQHMPETVSVEHILADTISHPSSFIRKSLFEKYGLYREDLKIISDWAFFYKLILFGRVSTKHIPLVISSFAMDGISSNPENDIVRRDEAEKVYKDTLSAETHEILYNYYKYRNFYNKSIFVLLRRIYKICNQAVRPSFWKQLIYRRRMNSIIRLTNKTVRQQRKDPTTIPILIISYNRLADLKELVDFLIERNHKNIVIVDNMSTYPPLLDYYEKMKDRVTVRIMDKNYGHLVFWQNEKLYNEFSKGYYIVTDSDIIPNNRLPHNYLNRLMSILDNHKETTKVGFALRIDDIPDTFPLKKGAIDWEMAYWEKPIEENVYDAAIDTTFAIYPPQYKFYYPTFYDGIRVAGDFIAKHGGFYIDPNNLTDEQIYYFKTASDISTWKRENKDSVEAALNKPEASSDDQIN